MSGGGLQLRGTVPGLLKGITASSGGQLAGPHCRPMERQAESSQQHVNHSTLHTIPLCLEANTEEWRRLSRAQTCPTKPECQETRWLD